MTSFRTARALRVNRATRIFILLFILGGSLAGWCQPASLLPHVDDTPEYREVGVMISRGEYSPARQRCLDIADQHPGTDLGGKALLTAARISTTFLDDKADGNSLLLRLVDEYRGTAFEVVGLRNLELTGAPLSEEILQIDSILRRFDAPTITEIMSAPNQEHFLEAQALHPEIRAALTDLYIRPIYPLATEGRISEALKICAFGREVLDPVLVSTNSFGRTYNYVLASSNPSIGEEQFGTIAGQVRFEIISPQDGSVVPFGTPLVATATTGDYRYSRILLREVRLTVDSEDVTSDVLFETTLSTELKEGVDFEHLRFTLPGTLPPGEHTAVLSLPVDPLPGEPQHEPTLVSWTFTLDRAE